VPKNPLRLRHQTLHATWLNSRAIAVLGLEAPDFIPPLGANMIRDAAGKLTGLVVGMETWLSDHLPLVTAAESESAAPRASSAAKMAAAGVTAFTDATTPQRPRWKSSSSPSSPNRNAICQRVSVMIGGQHLEAADQFEKARARAGGISLAGAKFMPGYQYDTGRASRARFAARSRARSRLRLSRDRNRRARRGKSAAIESAKSAILRTRARCRGFRIEHGGIITPDYIDRLMAANVWVVTNPGFIYFRGPKYAAEPGLVAHLYRAARSLKDANVHLVGATDAPVTPAKPFAAIVAAVSRTTIDGGRSRTQRGALDA